MKTITIIGMMGAGKTTVGKLLGQFLKFDFIDTDSEIEKQTGKSISEIFAKYGEEYFRTLEKNVIKTIFNSENKIISTGGGAFENKEIRDLLLENSTVVYLKTTPDVIFERIKNNSQRPLLKNNMNIETITEILNNRQKNYELAHHTIVTDNKNPNEIMEEILGVL
jgi:shikimate kinase